MWPLKGDLLAFKGGKLHCAPLKASVAWIFGLFGGIRAWLCFIGHFWLPLQIFRILARGAVPTSDCGIYMPILVFQSLLLWNVLFSLFQSCVDPILIISSPRGGIFSDSSFFMESLVFHGICFSCFWRFLFRAFFCLSNLCACTPLI